MAVGCRRGMYLSPLQYPSLSPTDPMRSIVCRIVYVQGHGAVMITVYSVKTMKDNIMCRHVCIWETN